MNAIPTKILEVLSEPEFHDRPENPYWTKGVKVDCYGGIFETVVSAKTKEGLDVYVVGYIYQS